ncbi:37664_t:CDS:2, partial [Gigaspora margarita]
LDATVKREAKAYLEKLKYKLNDDNISNQKIMKIENEKKNYLSVKDFKDFKVINMRSKKENDSFDHFIIGKKLIPFHILDKDKEYEAIYKKETIFYVINGEIKEIK